MIRGMKKKLLIGLLTAAVVGSSLAPSVPYSGEFTQEVKADTTTSQKFSVVSDATNNISTDITVTKPAHTHINGDPTFDSTANPNTLTFDVEPDDGYRFVNKAKTKFDVTVGSDGKFTTTSFDVGGSVKLIQEKLEIQKGSNLADGATITVDKDTLDLVDNTKAVVTIKAKEGRTFKTAPKVNVGGAGAEDATKVDDSTYTYQVEKSITAGLDADKTTAVVVSGGEYDVLANITVDDSKLNGATVSLSKTSGITKDEQVTVTVTPDSKCTFDPNVAENLPKVNADNGLSSALTLTKDGDKYVGTIPAGGFAKDDVKLTITGTANYVDSKRESSTNSKGKTVTINKSVTSATRTSADASEVYDAVKNAGWLSSELNDMATATEAKTLAVNADIKANASVPGQISTAVQDAKLNLGYAFDIEVTKSYGTAVDTPITDLGNNLITLTVQLPTDQQGKANYVVYRVHNGAPEALTATPNANGEYIHATGKEIQIHASKFSTFAVAYGDEAATTDPTTTDPTTTDPTTTDPTTTDPTTTDPATTDPTTTDTTNGTTAATAGTTGATTAKADSAQKAAPAAKKLSAKTGSPKTADYAVNSLLALLTGAAGLFGISLMNSKKRKDEDQ